MPPPPCFTMVSRSVQMTILSRHAKELSTENLAWLTLFSVPQPRSQVSHWQNLSLLTAWTLEDTTVVLKSMDELDGAQNQSLRKLRKWDQH